jgi:hypothetical protein
MLRARIRTSLDSLPQGNEFEPSVGPPGAARATEWPIMWSGAKLPGNNWTLGSQGTHKSRESNIR